MDSSNWLSEIDDALLASIQGGAATKKKGRSKAFKPPSLDPKRRKSPPGDSKAVAALAQGKPMRAKYDAKELFGTMYDLEKAAQPLQSAKDPPKRVSRALPKKK
jgi:hypothetical protein